MIGKWPIAAGRFFVALKKGCMAVDVTEMVTTTEAAPAPEAAPVTRIEAAPAGTSTATEPRALTPDASATDPSAEPEADPEPDVEPSEWLKKHPNGKLAKFLNGHVGARLERDRKEQQERAMRAQQAQLETYIREQEVAELRLRQQEDERLKTLAMHDPNFELEDFTKSVYQRRAQVDWQRQQTLQVQQQAAQAEEYRLNIHRDDDRALYEALPPEVQAKVREFEPEAPTKLEARKLWLAEVRKQERAYYEERGKGTKDEEIKALVAKELARHNISVPEYDLGGGMPTTSHAFRTMEEAEAAYRQNKISTAEFMQVRDSGLKYARGF